MEASAKPPILDLALPSSRQLFKFAVEVMGSPPAAAAWLDSPQWGLGGARPVDFAAEHGTTEVLLLLGRIEHGVFS